jgi:hypothetical protein
MHLLAAIVALVGVNVVPMDSERVLPGQTVIVEDARVVTIGPPSHPPLRKTVCCRQVAGLQAALSLAQRRRVDDGRVTWRGSGTGSGRSGFSRPPHTGHTAHRMSRFDRADSRWVDAEIFEGGDILRRKASFGSVDPGAREPSEHPCSTHQMVTDTIERRVDEVLKNIEIDPGAQGQGDERLRVALFHDGCENELRPFEEIVIHGEGF